MQNLWKHSSLELLTLINFPLINNWDWFSIQWLDWKNITDIWSGYSDLLSLIWSLSENVSLTACDTIYSSQKKYSRSIIESKATYKDKLQLLISMKLKDHDWDLNETYWFFRGKLSKTNSLSSSLEDFKEENIDYISDYKDIEEWSQDILFVTNFYYAIANDQELFLSQINKLLNQNWYVIISDYSDRNNIKALDWIEWIEKIWENDKMVSYKLSKNSYKNIDFSSIKGHLEDNMPDIISEIDKIIEREWLDMPKMSDFMSMMRKLKEDTPEKETTIKITRDQIESWDLDEKEKVIIEFVKSKWWEAYNKFMTDKNLNLMEIIPSQMGMWIQLS